jgi:fumarate hydratase class II
LSVWFFAAHDGQVSPDREHLAENLAIALMVVTALIPRIGYDRRRGSARSPYAENTTLKQAAEQLGYVQPEDFDRRVMPAAKAVRRGALPGDGD